jgi:PAS domain S-box-containing protein
MVWISGQDNLFAYFNRPWLEFTGRSLEEEVGMGWTKGIHPEDVESCLASYAAAFENLKPCRIEYRHRRFDGQYRWLLDQCMPRYEEGELRGFIGYRIDGNQRKAGEEAVRELSGQLINAQENERARIARDLHDNLGQRVAMLSIDIELLKQGIPRSEVAVREQLDSIYHHTAELSRDIRRLSHQLHSAMLDHVGLLAATQELCQQVSQQHGIAVELKDHNVPGGIPGNISLCLFRVLQESLNNIVKHSGAKAARVELLGCENVLTLHISDSGKGFDPGSHVPGLGLISMKERLRLVGGKFSLQSAPSAGTEITVQVPLLRAVQPGTPRPQIVRGASYAQAARAVGR